MINCSLGDDGVPSYEDTCSFTCNTGYELTDSDTRTCQSDGSWSDSDDVCRRGMQIAMSLSCSHKNLNSFFDPTYDLIAIHTSCLLWPARLKWSAFLRGGFTTL